MTDNPIFRLKHFKWDKPEYTNLQTCPHPNRLTLFYIQRDQKSPFCPPPALLMAQSEPERGHPELPSMETARGPPDTHGLQPTGIIPIYFTLQLSMLFCATYSIIAYHQVRLSIAHFLPSGPFMPPSSLPLFPRRGTCALSLSITHRANPIGPARKHTGPNRPRTQFFTVNLDVAPSSSAHSPPTASSTLVSALIGE